MNLSSSREDGLTLRARLKLATRDAILDAAADAFASEGAAHVRIEDIASRAGVAVGTVYNYFTDRTALVNALLETRTQGLIDALDGMPAAAATTAAERFAADLRHFVAVLARYVDANHVLLHVLIEEEQQRGTDSKSARRRRSVLGQLLERAERLMADGIRARALQKGDPVVYASLLLGMIRGVGATALPRGGLRVADSSAAIVAVFLHGAAR
ncbi:MAG: TetR/AcrR family transcriptional regulator [Acidobacteria bacterium]|nr:TetR/AcrR family transcriptional regulator [Acidobacteriota bacterium]